MRNKRAGNPFQALLKQVAVPRSAMVGVILVVALLAFEMFNFDTTQYALRSLLGDIRFMGLGWATILAVAFCAIDFAGLARLFTPERGADEPKEVWYLMGAWLLGASMNAVMTWWAVSLTLLNHPFGNEVLSREELLRSVPVFVAILVWLTRILFIGSLTVAGEKLLYGEDYEPRRFSRRSANKSRTATTNARTATSNARPRRAVPKPQSRPAPASGAPVEEYVPYYAASANGQRSMGEPTGCRRPHRAWPQRHSLLLTAAIMTALLARPAPAIGQLPLYALQHRHYASGRPGPVTGAATIGPITAAHKNRKLLAKISINVLTVLGSQIALQYPEMQSLKPLRPAASFCLPWEKEYAILPIFDE